MTRTTPEALLLLALAACSGGGPPATVPAPSRDAAGADNGRPRRVALTTGYNATALVERVDSIVISLPDGSRQFQRIARQMRFAVRVDRSGEVEARLDSLATQPSSMAPREQLIGTTWRGQLTREGLTDVKSSSRDPVAGLLAFQVASLFPAIPRGGASEGERWADTTGSDRQVEIFQATDQRRSEWVVGVATRRQGIETIPVTVVEEYEQLGRGEQAGREMRMSAQGVRSITYYVTMLGRIDGMSGRDSAQRMITIPATQQAIPTTQVVRTRVRWQ